MLEMGGSRKGDSQMKISNLHEAILTSRELDNIIKAVKPGIKERGFVRAIYHQMRRFDYGSGREVFQEISKEMRRRSVAARRMRGGKVESRGAYWQRVKEAAKKAVEKYEQALISSPELDEPDVLAYADGAAEKYRVNVADILKQL